MKTELSITLNTDQPLQVERVMFEALQSAIRDGKSESDIEILSGLMVAVMRSEVVRWEDQRRSERSERQTAEIALIVDAAVNGYTPDHRTALGSLRGDKVEHAIALHRKG